MKNLFEICKKIKKELNIPLKEWKNDLNYANSGKIIKFKKEKYEKIRKNKKNRILKKNLEIILF